MELRSRRQQNAGGIVWICPSPSHKFQRRCAASVQEAFARQGPVSPCAICFNECDPEGAFTWPCHHSFHPDCVSRLHARTFRPDCPLCRTPWSVETDRQFRNVCTPCEEPEDRQPPHIVRRLPPVQPDNTFGTCDCTQPPTAMRWAPRATNTRTVALEWYREWRCQRCDGTAPAAAASDASPSSCGACSYSTSLFTERSGGTTQTRRGCVHCTVTTGSWYSHDFSHWPPTGTEGFTLGGRCYSWLFMPRIYDALNIPRHPSWRYSAEEQLAHTQGAWTAWVAEYREAFREASVDA